MHKRSSWRPGQTLGPGAGVCWWPSRKMWINRANFLASRSSPPIHLPILQLRIEGEEEMEQAAA